MGRLMRDVMRHWPWYFVSVASTVAYLLLDLVVRDMSGRLTDAALAQDQGFVRLLAATMAAFACTFPFHGISTWSKSTLSERLMYRMRLRMGEKVGKISIMRLGEERSGDILSRMGGELDTLSTFVLNGLSFITTLAVTFVATVSMLLAIDWLITLIIVAGMAVCVPLCYLFTKSVQKKELAMREALGRATQTAQQNFGAIDVIKSFRAEAAARRKYGVEVEQALFQEIKTLRTGAWSRSLGEVLGMLPFFAAMIVGAFQVSAGRLSAGDLVSVFALGFSFCTWLRGTPDAVLYLQKSYASCERVYGFLDLPEEQGGSNRLPDLSSAVVDFSHVDFSYTGQSPTLQDFSLRVERGQTVALVGPSGGGKSTVLRIICGFLPPQKGEARLFGTPVGQWDLPSLRKNISVVLQESYLSPGTLRENLLTARADADDQTLMQACRRAGVLQFVRERGLDTPVGERGGRLSGGERQRVAVARALLKDAPLLLLDEPTSALDIHSEKAVRQGLNELMQGRTTVIATHRLNLARQADVILVISGGRVVQRGDHEQLLAQEGIYARMWREQEADDTTNSEKREAGHNGQAR